MPEAPIDDPSACQKPWFDGSVSSAETTAPCQNHRGDEIPERPGCANKGIGLGMGLETDGKPCLNGGSRHVSEVDWDTSYAVRQIVEVLSRYQFLIMHDDTSTEIGGAPSSTRPSGLSNDCLIHFKFVTCDIGATSPAFARVRSPWRRRWSTPTSTRRTNWQISIVAAGKPNCI